MMKVFNFILLLIGLLHVVRATLVGFAPGSRSVAELSQLTGVNPELVRIYFGRKEGVPTSLSKKKIEDSFKQGRTVVISFKFTGGKVPTQKDWDNLKVFCEKIKQGGYGRQAVLSAHHEAYPELSGKDYVSKIHVPFYDYVKKHCGNEVRVGVILQSYAVLHGKTKVANYFPTNPAKYDFVGVDHYPTSDPDGTKANPFLQKNGKPVDPLHSIREFTTFAKQHNKPYLVAEFGIHKRHQHLPQAANWVLAFAKVQSNCIGLSYFNQFGYGLEELLNGGKPNTGHKDNNKDDNKSDKPTKKDKKKKNKKVNKKKPKKTQKTQKTQQNQNANHNANPKGQPKTKVAPRSESATLAQVSADAFREERTTPIVGAYIQLYNSKKVNNGGYSGGGGRDNKKN